MGALNQFAMATAYFTLTPAIAKGFFLRLFEFGFEIWSCFVTPLGLKLSVLLPQPSKVLVL